MRAVTASITCPATVHEAITVWCAVDRWSHWVEGLDRVLAVTNDWPQPGGVVQWQSRPAGRGGVTERVVAFEPLASIDSEIEDDQVIARQLVSFAPASDGTESEVTIDFGYRIKRRSPVTPVVDWLFVRPAMTTSLRTTLARFEAEVRAAAH